MRRKTHSKGRSSHGGRNDDFCLCEELRCVNVWGESEEWVRLPASVWVLVSFKILLLGLFRDVAGTGDLSCWNRSKQGGMGLFAYCLKKKNGTEYGVRVGLASLVKSWELVQESVLSSSDLALKPLVALLIARKKRNSTALKVWILLLSWQITDIYTMQCKHYN